MFLQDVVIGESTLGEGLRARRDQAARADRNRRHGVGDVGRGRKALGFIAQIDEGLQLRAADGPRVVANLLCKVISTEDPVAAVTERAGEAQFLGDRFLRRVVGANAQIRVREVDVDEVEGVEGAPGGYRGQRRIFELLVEFDRQPHVLVLGFRQVVDRRDVVVPAYARNHVRRRRHVIAEYRCGREDSAIRVVRKHDRSEGHAQKVRSWHADARRPENVVCEQPVDARRANAAHLVDLGVVADDAHVEIAAVVVAELQPDTKTVAIAEGVVLHGHRRYRAAEVINVVVHEAVALRREDRATQGEIVAQRYIGSSRDPLQVAIAGRHLEKTVDTVGAGRNRDDLDGARRRVLAEQCALRATPDLDGRDIHQLIDHRTLPRAIHAVDVQAHRRFDAEVVTCGSDATDSECGRRARLTGADEQPRNALLQVNDILDARGLDVRPRYGCHRGRLIHDVDRALDL